MAAAAHSPKARAHRLGPFHLHACLPWTRSPTRSSWRLLLAWRKVVAFSISGGKAFCPAMPPSPASPAVSLELLLLLAALTCWLTAIGLSTLAFTLAAFATILAFALVSGSFSLTSFGRLIRSF